MLDRLPWLALLPLAACVGPQDDPLAAEVETLAADQDRPTGIAVRDELISWANSGEQEGEGNGELIRCGTLDCSDGPVVLYDELAAPNNPLFAGDRLVWQTHATVDGAGRFGSRTLYSAPADGSSTPWPLIWIGAGLEITAATTDGTRVYFGTDDESDSLLAWCPAAGCPEDGTAVNLISDDLSGASALARSSGALFVAETYSGDIVRVQEGAGTKETLASLQVGVFGLTHDPTHLYWGTAVGDLGAGVEVQNYLARVPLDGGPVEELLDTEAVTAVLASGDWLYFGERSGVISRMALDTLEVEALASGFGEPSSFVHHQGHLYWTDRTPGGGVYRMAL